MLLGLRSLAAILVGALVLAGLDAGLAGLADPSVLAFVVGGLALVASPLALLAPVVATIPAVSRAGWAKRSALGILALVPLVPVVVGRGGDMLSLSVPTLLLLVLFPVAATFVFARLVQRLWGEPDRRGWIALTLAAALATASSVAVTVLESNLIQIRPGYELTHLGLFLGTWSGAFALTLPLALAFGVPDAQLRWTHARRGLGGLALVGSLGLHAADQRILLDLHLGVHLWARAAALWMMVSAVALLAAPLAWSRRRGLAAGALFLATGGYFVSAPAPATDMVFRSKVGHGELGRTLLRWRPMAPYAVGTQADPRLDFARGHEILAPKPAKNLLLVTVDTLRADALADMPRVSAFAARGLRFDRVYAPSSGTNLSLPVAFAGRNVSELDWALVFSEPSGRELSAEDAAAKGGGDWLRFSLLSAPPDRGGLARRLRDTGRRTHAAIDDGLFYFRPPAGRLYADFDRFDMVLRQRDRRAEAVVDQALVQIDAAGDAAWFEWVHLFDPHDYEAASREEKAAAYRGQVEIVDAALGRLVDELDARGRLADTAILISADHGEAFGEHGHWGHQSSLYEEQVRVPLILVGPGIPPGVSDQLVSSVDIAPTLVALGGGSLEGFTGLNLLSVLDGQVVERPVFMAQLWYARQGPRRQRDVKAVVWGQHKLIWRRDSESLELYDLAADPSESSSLVRRGEASLDDLQRLLRDHVSRAEAEHPLP